MISIHAAREGGDVDVRGTVFIGADISIHAAREGGDIVKSQIIPQIIAFQSTPPVKAATTTASNAMTNYKISIHAAREGGDVDYIDKLTHTLNFNPRRP